MLFYDDLKKNDLLLFPNKEVKINDVEFEISDKPNKLANYNIAVSTHIDYDYIDSHKKGVVMAETTQILMFPKSSLKIISKYSYIFDKYYNQIRLFFDKNIKCSTSDDTDTESFDDYEEELENYNRKCIYIIIYDNDVKKRNVTYYLPKNTKSTEDIECISTLYRYKINGNHFMFKK